MKYLMTEKRFEFLILEGKKSQTVRKSCRFKVGEVISLRQWTGLPYRSKQKKICWVSIRSIQKCRVSPLCVSVMDKGLPPTIVKLDAFAQADGFLNPFDMICWLARTHALPFDGFLIKWNIIGGAGLEIF